MTGRSAVCDRPRTGGRFAAADDDRALEELFRDLLALPEGRTLTRTTRTLLWDRAPGVLVPDAAIRRMASALVAGATWGGIGVDDR